MSTYLLVHGAWHSGRSWERVVPILESAGHRVFAPSLTGHGDKAHLLAPEVGLGTHIDDIVGLITREDLDDVVLVGHSYGGMVISGAADRAPGRITRLVYLDTEVPEDGEAGIDAFPVIKQLVDDAVDGWRIPPPPEQPPPLGLFGVTDPDDVAWLRSMLSDLSARCLQEPVRLSDPAARAIPRMHIHCVGGRRADIPRRPVPVGEAKRELPTGHDCMITMPAALSELLLEPA
ncbi:alpha/beta fold hydrolase [Saccharopolyspora sp. NPDC047091]|uniref:alpha/beta fold hydrolase n=1 Tax=Saccharopolyspora sp. NPDC047091 TaxID=3155924 RepID=UPI0033D68B5C